MSVSRAPTTPASDVREEALRLVGSAADAGMTIRVTGGVAVALQCPSALKPPLAREYKDLDLAGKASERKGVEAFLTEMGYLPHKEFNSLHGHSRLLYWDTPNHRQLDVFLDRFAMCHELDLGGRLEIDGITLSPTDLLLTKLQVVETNERDLKDAIALLLDCQIDVDRFGDVLGSDWGWWRTATLALGKVTQYAATLERFGQAEQVRRAVMRLEEAVAARPKSMRWRVRARVGERVRWYNEPEEESESADQ